MVICCPTSMLWSHSVTQPHFLMENSMYSSLVGEEVMENMASPTPGMDSMAHWPGLCSKAFLPSGVTTRKVFTSGVSMRISVTTPIVGHERFPVIHSVCLLPAFSSL